MKKLSTEDTQNKLHRVVEVYVPHPLGPTIGNLGSGFAVTDDLVLTAKHVVQGAKQVRVRGLGEEWPTFRDAEVVWLSAKWDAALVRLAGAPWLNAPDRGELHWGHISGPVPIRWIAYGFPQVARLRSGLGRDNEGIWGVIVPGGGFKQGILSLNIKSSLPLPSKQCLSFDTCFSPEKCPSLDACVAEHSSPWQGLSGAAILTEQDRQLLGLIVYDPPGFEFSRLEGIPVEHLVHDPVFAQLVGGQTTEPTAGQSKQKIQTLGTHPTQEQRLRTRLIKCVQEKWIEGLLSRSFSQVAWLDLCFQDQPDVLQDQLKYLVQDLHHPPRPLPEGENIVQIYDDSGESLLILGEPGTGKTTLLLELGRTLLTRAEYDPNHPIPVVFPLSSWARNRLSLADWIIEELQHPHYDLGASIARDWVKTDRILPLLDGLDEVTADARMSCVEAITEYYLQRRERGVPSLVVCCRSREFAVAAGHLPLRRAVSVLLLTKEQVDRHLQQTGNQLMALREIIHGDAELFDLIRRPLVLNIFTQVYQEATIVDLLTEPTPEAKLHAIFTRYVERVLSRRGALRTGTPEQFRQWLAFLARQLHREQQTIFSVEDLQPDWLHGTLQRFRWSHRLLVGLSSGLSSGLSGGLLFGLFSGLFLGPLVGLLVGLFVGLLFGLTTGLLFGLTRGRDGDRIRPAEVISLSWKDVHKVLLSGLLVALCFGALNGLLFGISGGLSDGLFEGLLWGAFFGLTGGLFGLLNKLSAKQLTERASLSPNEGVRRSGKNGLLIGLVAALLIGLVVGLPIGLFAGASSGLFVGLLVGPFGGLCSGLFIGMGFGLDAFIQHFILRFWLWRTNCLPWDLIPFLDEAAERTLLHKVGGSYIFVHRLLRDYFTSSKGGM